MTRFSDPDVYACPACAAYFTRSALMSFNLSGTRDWSDGAPTAWWAVTRTPLVRCSSCRALFWIDDVESLGVRRRPPHPPIGRFERLWAQWRGDPRGRLRDEVMWHQNSEGWEAAKSADTASFDDVAYVLANSAGVSTERLLWLRRRVWWRLNDRYRTQSDGSRVPNVPTWPEAEERANMEALLDLLALADAKSSDLVQKGEILRLLGRFAEAIAVLKAVPADGHNEIRAVKIERLARKGDLAVRPLGDEVP
jgi:hypothetical protein